MNAVKQLGKYVPNNGKSKHRMVGEGITTHTMGREGGRGRVQCPKSYPCTGISDVSSGH